MSLRAKLYIGFITAIFLAMIVGLLAIISFRIVRTNVDTTNTLVSEVATQILPVSAQFDALTKNMSEAGSSYYAYTLSRANRDYIAGDEALGNARLALIEIEKILKKAAPDSMPTTRKNVAIMFTEGKKLEDITSKLQSMIQSWLSIRGDMEKQAASVDSSLLSIVAETKTGLDAAIKAGDEAASLRRSMHMNILTDIMSGLDDARILFWKAQSQQGDQADATYTEQIASMQGAIDLIVRYNTPENVSDTANRNLFNRVLGEMTGYRDNVEKIKTFSSQINNEVNDMFKTYQALSQAVTVASAATDRAMNGISNNILSGMRAIEGAVDRYSFWVIVAVFVALVVGLTVATVLVRNITLPVQSIIGTLTTSSEQIGSASDHISSASQELADGANSQASALEETSSALEEMASMTRQNADNAQKTNETTTQNNRIVEQGVEAMANMSAAMADISDKSEKVSHIVKTIEDIAFQTNLLALNAAVEAARAGEAGKGFAVVADEVRNLSQRSAQAAKDTTELIMGTVESVKNGNDIVSQLTDSFTHIEQGSRQVGILIGEITAATNEQAQGMDQINHAVAQMDKVTQQNAASSEETASSSVELQNQSEALSSAIDQLVGLVSGKSGNPVVAVRTPGNAGRKPVQQGRPMLSGPSSSADRQPRTAKVDPSTLIPLEESFDDF